MVHNLSAFAVSMSNRTRTGTFLKPCFVHVGRQGKLHGRNGRAVTRVGLEEATPERVLKITFSFAQLLHPGAVVVSVSPLMSQLSQPRSQLSIDQTLESELTDQLTILSLESACLPVEALCTEFATHICGYDDSSSRDNPCFWLYI